MSALFKNNLSDRKLILIFSLFVLILYINSIRGDFVFDDTFLVRDNPYLDSCGDFISYFTSGTREMAGRPVRLTSFYLDTLLFGKNSSGYHVSNIFYYALLCSLIYFFSKRLFENRILAAMVTLLFIAHPLHTEGVAYISGRKDVLGGIFCIASLIWYDRYAQSEKQRDVLLALLFFLLAIGTKEIYVLLPFLYIAVSHYRRNLHRKQKMFILTLLAGATIFVLYVTLIRNRVFFDYLHTIPVYGDNKGVNFATAIKICGLILQLSFFPFRLSADYTFNAVKRIEISEAAFMISLSALFLVGCGVLLLHKRQKEIAFGLLWLLICLLPVCQIVPYPEIISERSLILLSFGSCVIFACLISRLPGRWSFGVLLAILMIFSATTIRRNFDWHNDLNLWQVTAKQHPECARARYNLGVELARREEYAAAEREFLASLAINPPQLVTVPDYSLDALLNLGNVYAFRGDFAHARDCYTSVLSHDPHKRLALQNLKAIERWEQGAEVPAKTGR